MKRRVVAVIIGIMTLSMVGGCGSKDTPKEQSDAAIESQLAGVGDSNGKKTGVSDDEAETGYGDALSDSQNIIDDDILSTDDSSENNLSVEDSNTNNETNTTNNEDADEKNSENNGITDKNNNKDSITDDKNETTKSNKVKNTNAIDNRDDKDSSKNSSNNTSKNKSNTSGKNNNSNNKNTGSNNKSENMGGARDENGEIIPNDKPYDGIGCNGDSPTLVIDKTKDGFKYTDDTSKIIEKIDKKDEDLSHYNLTWNTPDDIELNITFDCIGRIGSFEDADEGVWRVVNNSKDTKDWFSIAIWDMGYTSECGKNATDSSKVFGEKKFISIDSKSYKKIRSTKNADIYAGNMTRNDDDSCGKVIVINDTRKDGRQYAIQVITATKDKEKYAEAMKTLVDTIDIK